MHDQRPLTLQRQEQILAPPSQPLDPRSLDGRFKLSRRRRPTPARIEHLQRLDPPPLNLRLKLPTNSLHLGQLRHPAFLHD